MGCGRSRHHSQHGAAASAAGAAASDGRRMYIRRGKSETAEPAKVSPSVNGMVPSDEPMTVLLVFAREDAQSVVFAKAAERLGLPCETVSGPEAAMESYICCRQDLVIIDRRRGASKQPQQLEFADSLVKAMRAVSQSEFTTFVAATGAASDGNSSSASLSELVRLGFDLKFPESVSVESCTELLTSVWHNNFQLQQKLAALTALFTALDACSDSVEITNEKGQIQYINAAQERLHGRSLSELLGRSCFEQQQQQQAAKFDKMPEESAALLQTLRKGREFEEDFCSPGRGGAAASGPASQQLQRRRQTRRYLPVKGRHGKMQHIVCVTTRCKEHLPTTAKPPPSSHQEICRHVGEEGEKTDDRSGKDIDSMKRSRSEMMGIIRKTSMQSMRSVSSIPLDASLFGALSRMAKIDCGTGKIGSQSLEAPIHKVIQLIGIAQQDSPPSVTSALDRVLEILHHATDLYSGELPATLEDKITSDYVGGLMIGARPADKKRSGHFGTRQSSLANMQSLSEIPEQFIGYLEGDDEWEFDILELERVTNNRPLVYLGMKILQRFNVCQLLQCSEDTMLNWLQVIQDNYHQENCYHNATHGADVMQSSAYFLERIRVKAALDEMDEAASIIGALVHDLDHPGRTNPFLINSRHRLALLYNDVSVLESHHVSLAFQLTTRDDRINIFKNLPPDEYKSLRQGIVDVVLATEMARHFEHVGKFANQIVAPLLAGRDSGPSDEASSGIGNMAAEEEALELLAKPENRALIMRVLIKCSDISNQCRPLKLCKEWSRRISEEYFQQTDEEKALDLPIVMPMFDRANCNLPQSQISFIDFFLREMFSVWHAFCDVPQLLDNMNNNYAYWKQLAAERSHGGSGSGNSEEQ
ncbi:hypothetical protein BOX15_Mlig033139g2 [Macrostomum lignano]|uniref:Phosphodiesterase n=2 Tax=Macrostomum lignano TaxID=282301 RepID=A0A267DYJ0_9PLAT|nr:hypothetical protein BOX15_Mlig033139g2 [Macrostomum lignano]